MKIDDLELRAEKPERETLSPDPILIAIIAIILYILFVLWIIL